MSNQSQQKELDEAEKVFSESIKRLDKVDLLIRKLFEEKCLGNMPEAF